MQVIGEVPPERWPRPKAATTRANNDSAAAPRGGLRGNLSQSSGVSQRGLLERASAKPQENKSGLRTRLPRHGARASEGAPEGLAEEPQAGVQQNPETMSKLCRGHRSDDFSTALSEAKGLGWCHREEGFQRTAGGGMGEHKGAPQDFHGCPSGWFFGWTPLSRKLPHD